MPAWNNSHRGALWLEITPNIQTQKATRPCPLLTWSVLPCTKQMSYDVFPATSTSEEENRMNQIQFFFESNVTGQYVDVLAESKMISGAIVSQNAGSTNHDIYYQVGGSGLNGAFARALGPQQVVKVNNQLQVSYDEKFGKGSWARDSKDSPSPSPLTSLLVPVEAGTSCIGMMYSVGPRLTRDGLTPPSEKSRYTQIYADAMNEIAKSSTKIDGFRITMLSSGIYRGDAPLADFADAAAGCILDAVCASVKAQPLALAQLTILINTNLHAPFPTELQGFTNAATARGATVTSTGFIIQL